MNSSASIIDQLYRTYSKFIFFVESRRNVRLAILAFTATIASSTLLFQSNFVWGPDIAFHIYNAKSYLVEMESGVFFPRWLGDWFGGYGAPIGVIYAPLLYLCSALLGLTGLDIVLSIKLLLWVGTFLSGIFMNDLAKTSAGNSAALLAGILYQIAPYRILDTVGRTALTEAFAFTWLPVIVLSMINFAETRRTSHLVKFAVFLSLLILTHLLIAYLFLAPSLLLGACLVFSRRKALLVQISLSLIFAITLSFLITAAYWIPAVTESRHLNSGWFYQDSGWGNYENNFLFGAQVYIGTELEEMYKENTKIGMISIIYGMIGFAWLSLRLGKRRLISMEPPANYRLDYWMCFILFLGLFMSTSLSRFVWDIIPKGEIIAFPWRWLTISTLAAAYLAGNIFHQAVSSIQSFGHDSSGNRPRLAFITLVVLVLIYCAASVYLLWHHRYIISDEITSQLVGKSPLSTELYTWVYANEYLPLEAKNLDVTALQVGETKLTSSRPIDVDVLTWQSANRKVSLTSGEQNTINIQTFWFPGWMLLLNGAEIVPRVEPSKGTMIIDIPPGASNLIMVFRVTPTRAVATQISIIGLILLIVTGIFSIVLEKRKVTQEQRQYPRVRNR